MLIIADDFAEDILGTLIFNRMKSGFTAVAVKSPSYGDNRKDILEDIAILCGGKVVSDETGIKLENATIDSGILGEAKRVVVNKENTVIIDGLGDKSAVALRANALRKQIETTKEDYDKDKLRERLARLTSGIGIISVGAITKAEQKELRDRVDDAFAAAKSAVKSGIVIGGGSALLKVKNDLKKLPNYNTVFGDLAEDEILGANILVESLEAPIRKILMNANIDASFVVTSLYFNNDNIQNIGYDVLTKKEVDMFEAGIIDPTDVVINEVLNAASVAGLLLTTDCLITEVPTDSSPTAASNCSPSSCASCGPHTPIM